MGRNDRWRGNGPSTSDVADYWRAMSAHHGAVVKMEAHVSFPNSWGNGVLRVRLVAQPGPGPELACGPLADCSVEAEWPSSSYSTFEALLYQLSYALDHKLSKEWWAQRPLPF